MKSCFSSVPSGSNLGARSLPANYTYEQVVTQPEDIASAKDDESAADPTDIDAELLKLPVGLRG